jgi:hypothetical protein
MPIPGERRTHQHGQRHEPVDRAVGGEAGICVIAKNVPENATACTIGISSAGRNADGSRRMLRRLRTAMPARPGPTCGWTPT